MTTSRPGSSAEAPDASPRGYCHRPVLVEETMSFLVRGPAGLYLDGTVGGGGHAAALLARRRDCRLLAVDRDPAAVRAARARLAGFGERARVARMSFRAACDDAEVRTHGLAGALLDLGASSPQLDDDRRGFTFRRGAPLDMRMDPDAPTDAAAFLAQAAETELAAALREGQAPRPRALAAQMVRRRKRTPLVASDDLVGALEAVLRRRSTHAEKARLFQALRMRVNDEAGALRAGLDAIRRALRPGGVLAVVSYHSGEDRIVKRAFRRWSDPHAGLPAKLPVRATARPAAGAALARRPVVAPPEEVRGNSRARGARLRAWRKAA